MNPRLPSDVAAILERGSLCYAAANTGRGPHLTPLVFVLSGHRLWLTTSRGSVKARAWRRDPRVAGLVRAGELAVSFAGTVRNYDVLEPGTWIASALAAPALTMAAARFSRKNARFFASYAVDARRVPLAWTPPGRVFAQIELSRAAVLDDGGVRDVWGSWKRGIASHGSFRASRTGNDPTAALPEEVRVAIGGHGRGALAVGDGRDTAVLPAGWAADGHGLWAAAPAEMLDLAGGAGPDARVALAMDRASWWRARDMVGAMAQGVGHVFVLARLGSGTTSAGARVRLAGIESERGALVRVEPRRLVWWSGWSSGAVTCR